MVRFLAASAVALVAAVPGPLCAQDLATTAGKQARVLLDNERVRVIELALPPGASTGVPSHGDHLVYFLADATGRQTHADGTHAAREVKAGEIQWSAATVHDTRNDGATPSRTLVIELKPAK